MAKWVKDATTNRLYSLDHVVETLLAGDDTNGYHVNVKMQDSSVNTISTTFPTKDEAVAEMYRLLLGVE